MSDYVNANEEIVFCMNTLDICIYNLFPIGVSDIIYSYLGENEEDMIDTKHSENK
jgi:hypothetical protein